MAFNRLKLERAVTFMKYFACVLSLIFQPKSWFWNKITFLASNLLRFAASQKRADEEHLQKNLPIFHFLSNLLLFIVKVLRAYNQRTR